MSMTKSSGTSTTTTTAAAAKTSTTAAAKTSTTDKQQQLKYIGSVVRALITSRKPPCFLREILREYSEVESKPLTFRNLGYNSAEELLRDTGEFTFNHFGGDISVSAKYNANTAHIASLVRGQKTSKSSHLSQVKQVRKPRPTNQNWNKSSYSTNVYQKLPPSANRFLDSQNRANNWDRNNNNNSKQPYKYQQQQQKQQPLQRQKSAGGSNAGTGATTAATSTVPDLRDHLNAKVQPVGNNNNNGNSNSNKMDLRERLNAKQHQQQQPQPQHTLRAQQQTQKSQQQFHSKPHLPAQQQQLKQHSPRPILGQNNGNSSSSNNKNNSNNNNVAQTAAKEQQQLSQQQQQRKPLLPAPVPQQQQQQQAQQLISLPSQQQQHQQQQQLLPDNDAIALASSRILAQREKQSQQGQQQRAELLAIQHKRQQQQLDRAIQQEQQHQQQQQQHQSMRPFPSQGGDRNVSISAAAGNSVQNRLRVKIQNGHSTNGNINGSGLGNSTSNSPDSSPAISSAGSEQMQNPFGHHIQQNRAHEPQPVIPPKVFQFNYKLDPVTSLSQYCTVRRYPLPEYSILRSKFSKAYQCRVHVNGSTYSTYPNEYQNEHLAKISCAQQAIEQIRTQESRRPLPPCTDSDHEITQKLFNELLTHPHGIFAKKIPEVFETKFERALPEHWWSLVQTSNKFTTETAASNAVILFANTEADRDESPSSIGGVSDQTTSAPTTPTTIQMVGITLPWTQKYWDLHITHCASTVEVWARLFGKEYSEKLDVLMNDIDLYMLTQKARPLSIACKSIYLVCIAECWHRVRVEELDKPNGTALCFFIDFGDADSVPVSKLHICDAKFLRLPAQAVPFSLFGLEDFAENPNARSHLDTLLTSKSVIGEILTKECDFYANESSSSGKIQIVLYDTSSNEDVNLNPLLLNRICNDTPPPEIKRTGVTNVLVTHVSDKGDLYMQISNSDLKYVQKLIQQLIESKFKREQHKITHNDLKASNLFLICDESAVSGTGTSLTNWYRGALTDAQFNADDEEFDIFYVDNGQTRRTHISKIFRLESLSAALSKFPRQAIKVRLHNIPAVTRGILGRMRALLPLNCEALVKLTTSAAVPLVTVYRRLEGNDSLCTINDTIRIEHELESLSEDFNAAGGDGRIPPTEINKKTSSLASPTILVEMTRGLTINSVPNSPVKLGELPKLKNYEAIPLDGDYFEVRVTMSANPSNFMIQPYADYPRLRSLMKELQEYCENNEEFIPADMVEIGEAYAAKNADGFYHRITVVNIYNEMIHVCFCDFGDITILRSDQLKILPAKFRLLPKMSIQAKLYGIVAKHGDWTLEDCLRFRSLTVAQKFVAVVKHISSDKNTKPEMQVLELELIDVRTEEDIYIHELLLKEERAISEV